MNQTLTLQKIRVTMAAEKQLGTWFSQKRSSLIRDFHHLSPAIHIGLEEGSGNREKIDHPLPASTQTIYLQQIVNPKPAVEPKPTGRPPEPTVEPEPAVEPDLAVELEPVVEPEPSPFNQAFSYLLPIIDFGRHSDRIAENESSGPPQQPPGHSVTVS
jgi:hypothetical protein